MHIILSPTKQMRIDTDTFDVKSMPVYLQKTEFLAEILQKMTFEELKEMWKCSDSLARQNEEKIRYLDLYHNLTPAVLAYQGLAFQHLAANAMTDQQLAYLQEHLRILSGFYGVLKPFDGIVPYRLEMGSFCKEAGSLYDYWGDLLYKDVKDDVIINLASKEYSLCVQPYVEENIRMINIHFMEWNRGKLVTKGTMAKMARGDMVYWLSEHEVENPEDIRRYDDGYEFREEYSDYCNYVFVRK